jgi:hypothetical protein
MRGRGRPQPASRFAAPQITGAQQETQLTRQLWECRPHMLDRYELDELCAKYNKVGRKKVEYLLTVARQKRAGEVRE